MSFWGGRRKERRAIQGRFEAGEVREVCGEERARAAYGKRRALGVGRCLCRVDSGPFVVC